MDAGTSRALVGRAGDGIVVLRLTVTSRRLCVMASSGRHSVERRKNPRGMATVQARPPPPTSPPTLRLNVCAVAVAIFNGRFGLWVT